MNYPVSSNEPQPFVLIMPQYCEELIRVIGQSAQIYRLSDPAPPGNAPAAGKTVARMDEQGLDALLKKLGIPRTVQGHRYIGEAVRRVAQDPSLTIALTKQLYPAIAAQYNTSAFAVERAMRYAIEMAQSRCDPHLWQQCFGGQAKPTNGAFITRLAHFLLEEGDEV